MTRRWSQPAKRQLKQSTWPNSQPQRQNVPMTDRPSPWTWREITAAAFYYLVIIPGTLWLCWQFVKASQC